MPPRRYSQFLVDLNLYFVPMEGKDLMEINMLDLKDDGYPIFH